MPKVGIWCNRGNDRSDRFFAFGGAIDTLYGGSGTDTAVIDEEDDDIPLDDIEELIHGS